VDRYPGQFDSARIGAVVEADDATDVLDGELSALSCLDQWQPLIDEASRRFDLPAAWIRAVMRAESGGRTMLDGRPITSRAGAMGLMQVMPETYEEMRRRYGLGADPHDLRDNILAGTAYLREMYDRYGYPGFFAAYNAGPARFDEYLFDGRPLPAETQRYLATLNLASLDTPTRPDWPSGRELFFKLGVSILGMRSPSSDSSSRGLFLPLHQDRPAPSPASESP
jgi:membrane-bound lytic murein transglycosylase B